MKSSCEYERELLRGLGPQLSYTGTGYEAWRKKARSKLSELLGMEKLILADTDLQIEYETESQIDGVTEIRFSYQSEPGYRVPGHLFIPKNTSQKPPVMICLQGHSSGMHISFGRPKYPGDEEMIQGGDRDFCVRAVREGFAAIAIEQRNFGESSLHDGRMCFQASMTALMQGRTTIGERVWDVMRLIDVLEQHFAGRLNTETICCMGNSGGGTATAYAAALEDRLVLAMPSCALCTYQDSIGAMYHCSCNYVPSIANYFDMNDLIAMAYPKLYIQVSGVEDGIFPILGAEEVFSKGKQVYDAHGVPGRCVLVKGAGGHRFYADAAWSVVKRLLNR